VKINTTGYTYQDSFNRERHGSLWDRGSADSYYGRPKEPHWYPKGTYNSPRIDNIDYKLTEEQIAEYQAGYDYNEQNGDKKDWGI
jgi:hypothetical protein